MKAQVLNAYNEPYVLTEVPLPKLTSPFDLLIKVEAASYCHTDAVCAAGGFEGHANGPTQWPHIGCHEFAGAVAQVPQLEFKGGPSIPRFQIGDRVGVPGRAFHPCGTCFECKRETTNHGQPGDNSGYSVYCPNAKNLGLSVAGGFAQYALVDSRQIAPLPIGMSAQEAAPLMCAGLTIYSALRNCELKHGQRVAIIGCGGGLGHLGIQFAERMGLKVLGIDTSKRALDLARQVAKTSKISNAAEVNAADLVHEIGKEDRVSERGQMGVDAAIILPESQQAFDYGMGLLKNWGRCVVVSFPKKGFTFSTQDVVFRHVSIIGSLVGSNKLLCEMLGFASTHGVKSVTKSFPLHQLNELVEQQHAGAEGKLIIDEFGESIPLVNS
ncbi:alcohol dehydrogenase-like protein [Penicillium concentricum]|uniref:Alcohol dehydrogenase-like protein n=1 Tax=Penicillium concentricum TaxID=293559 RepID=A0A9W9SPG0_9EURO|nr:alcohol dehydrogenase-like protein [Penicillium concentricum]KAJ5382248.1 alcohol dehydrogenase-like protein [Penicillium concentricum]